MLLLLYMRVSSSWPKKAAIFSLLTLFSLTLVVGLVPQFSRKASAATMSKSDIQNIKLTWVNRTTVSAVIGSDTYLFKRPHAIKNTGDKYKIQDRGECGGDGELEIKDKNSNVNSGNDVKGSNFVGKLKMKYVDPASATGACVNEVEKENIPIGSDANGDIFFGLTADDTIQLVDGDKDWVFKKKAGDIFLRTEEDGEDCQDRIVVKGSDMWLYELTDGGPDKFSQDAGLGKEKCKAAPNANHWHLKTDHKYLLADYRSSTGATNPIGSSGSSNLASNTAHVDCATGSGINFNPFQFADNAISWILCPLLDGAQGIVNTVGGWVVDQLEFKVDDYLLKPVTDTNGNQAVLPVKNAWNAFRIISLSLLIVVALAGLLLGSFIDAYTVKKVLPRMLIALIAISLSWDLMILFINVTNAAGVTVRAVIDTPFREINNASIDPKIILSGGALATGLTTILGALSLIGTAALAVLFAFIFTILRVAAIIAFVIFAPLAILAWVLPGTQKLWNFWQSGLAGALLMFPIVTAFLSIGAAFGKIIYYVDPNSGLNQAMALVATYAPYFLIPKAFSMAGGVVGNLSGMVNDRGKGAFDRLKKFREGQGEKRRHDLKEGKYFRGGDESNRRGWINKKVQTGMLAKEAGFSLDRQTRSARIESARAAHGFDAATKFLQESHEAKALTGDDDKYWAALEGGTDIDKIKESLRRHAPSRFEGADKQQALNEAAQDVLRFNKAGGAEVSRIAAVRGLGTASTSWKNSMKLRYKKDANGDDLPHTDANLDLDERGEKQYDVAKYDASGKMLKTINDVAGGHRGLSTRLLAEIRDSQVRAGRLDTGAASYAETAREMDNLRYVDGYTVEDATAGVTRAWTQGKSAIEQFGGKRANAEAAAPEVMRNLMKSLQSGDTATIAAGVATIAAAQDVAGQLAPENVDILAAQVTGKKISMADVSPTIREMFKQVDANGFESYPTHITGLELIERMSGDADFNTRRREYGMRAREGVATNQQLIAGAQVAGLAAAAPAAAAAAAPPFGGPPPTPPVIPTGF